MSQAPLVIGPNKPGITYRQEATLRAKALATHNAGAAAPAYAEAYLAWMDTSGTPWKLKIYDGADWITTGEFNAATNTYIPYVGTAPIRLINHVADSGVADAYVLAPTHAVTTYSVGQIVTLRPANNNTGACTLALSALAAKPIKLNDGTDPHSGALRTGGVYALMYDGTGWQLLNPTWPFGGLAFLDVLDEDDFASDSATRPPSQQSVKQYISDNGAGAYEHLATVTASNSAALDFTGIFTDEYIKFRFEFDKLRTSSASGTLSMRFSSDSGLNYFTTGYRWKAFTLALDNQPTAPETSTVSGSSVAQAIVLTDSGSSSEMEGYVEIGNLLSTTRIKIVRAQLSTAAGAQRRIYGSYVSSIAAMNAFRFYSALGNMLDGSIHCYGVRNT